MTVSLFPIHFTLSCIDNVLGQHSETTTTSSVTIECNDTVIIACRAKVEDCTRVDVDAVSDAIRISEGASESGFCFWGECDHNLHPEVAPYATIQYLNTRDGVGVGWLQRYTEVAS
jgi:hypothetical protein